MTAFPDNFDPVRFIKKLVSHGHNKMVGVEYYAHGSDWCELALPYQESLIGDSATGIIASGPIFTMMDMAATISIWIRAGAFQPQATLDLRVDYLRSAKPKQAVFGRMECYHITKSVAFIRGQAHDGDPDRPIAHVACTYFFTAES
jgi:uncharacterized protein (TIGR00369 family)